MPVSLDSELASGRAAATAETIDQPPLGDHGDIGRFGTEERIEAGGRPPELDEDLLHGVFGVGQSSTCCGAQRPDQAAIRGQAFVDGGCLAGRHSFQNTFRHRTDPRASGSSTKPAEIASASRTQRNYPEPPAHDAKVALAKRSRDRVFNRLFAEGIPQASWDTELPSGNP